MGRYIRCSNPGSVFVPGHGRVRHGDVVEGDFDRVPGLVEVDDDYVAKLPEVELKIETEEIKPLVDAIDTELYDDMNVAAAIEYLEDMSTKTDLLWMRQYEKAHKNRKGVLRAIKELLGAF